MAKLSRSLSSFLIVVGFLVLTALAAILYGGSKVQQEKMKQNFLWRGARYTTDTLWGIAVGKDNPELDNNPNVNQKIKNEASQSGLDDVSLKEVSAKMKSEQITSRNFWANLKERLTKGWGDKGVVTK